MYPDKEKHPEVNNNKNRNVYFCIAYSRYFSTSIHRVINNLKKSFKLSWLIVKIYYHIFNNLSRILNRDLAAKIGQGILSCDLMDRECNYSLRIKVKDKYAYEGKCRNYV